ncbi:hypothetical protein Cflav_PD5196 [Pedosphaera parvula Ellin514]|uniref:Uncharacterized protein n=1 Tax=Pedosphaera parvula (strain Ellin514) TaxID=320771 RepID=B9XC93_PEDPL|nr:hypothetical protein Cflav_PD5196 [Pedosphaera parvula Ellin514]
MITGLLPEGQSPWSYGIEGFNFIFLADGILLCFFFHHGRKSHIRFRGYSPFILNFCMLGIKA